MNLNTLDQVTLVNDKDEVIGSMDKVEAHRGKGKLHRAVSVYLFKTINNSSELLIQQRSDRKIVGAHQWANTICGNVRPTESYEECAHRRLREELGIIKVNIEPVYKFRYQLQCNAEFSENEIDQVFVGWYDGEVKPNPDEVQEYAWVDWEKLVTGCQLSVIRKDNFNTKNVQLTTDNRPTDQLVLSPWFVHMLGDEELMGKINQYVNL